MLKSCYPSPCVGHSKEKMSDRSCNDSGTTNLDIQNTPGMARVRFTNLDVCISEQETEPLPCSRSRSGSRCGQGYSCRYERQTRRYSPRHGQDQQSSALELTKSKESPGGAALGVLVSWREDSEFECNDMLECLLVYCQLRVDPRDEVAHVTFKRSNLFGRGLARLQNLNMEQAKILTMFPHANP